MAVKVGQVLIDVKADTTKLVKGMDRAKKSVDNTIRNMKRALVGFASVQLFKGLITQGLQYNSALETTQQSIAGLLVATSKLEDAQGNVISSQKLYNTAMKESAGILEELQRINEQTPISLNETAQVYKTILPSMRAVGATQEELIELTKNLAVASGVAGIKSNQLLAGVDGLATGTVLANSELGRFLSALGLTNDKLKESKDVVELLNSRLKLLKGEITMDMQLSNLGEAWNSTLGAMTQTLWSESKEWIAGLINYLKEFKEGIKVLPLFFKAMAMAISDIWTETMLRLKVLYEEFIDVVKIAVNWATSFGRIDIGVNLDLADARNELSDFISQAKTGREHLHELLNAQPKATGGGDKTVASSMVKSIEKATEATKTLKAVTKGTTNEMKDDLDEVASIYDEMGESAQYAMGDAFRSWQDGALNFKETMRNVLNDVAAMIFEKLVIKQLFDNIGGSLGGGSFSSILGMFAQGGAFTNGVQRFATGGVVNSPTIFPMASGMGLAGEAGAEGILPLTRINGDLGVKAKVAPVVVNVQNYGNDNVQVEQSDGNINVIISQIAQSISRGTGDIGNAIEARYSLKKQ